MTHRSIPQQRRTGSQSTREFDRLCHDLRQCLGTGILLASLPEGPNRPDLPPEISRRFDLMLQTLRHAADLVETMTQESAPSRRRMDLREVAQDCVSVAEVGHKVRFVSDTPLPAHVHAYPLILHRAIANMIDNAGRAAGDLGDVLVRVGVGHGEAWVEVVDDGPGFGEIEHGTGQGLSVVSSAVRASGGRLEIASGPGPGTTVRLVLPRHEGGHPAGQSAEPSAYSSNDAFQSP